MTQSLYMLPQYCMFLICVSIAEDALQQAVDIVLALCLASAHGSVHMCMPHAEPIHCGVYMCIAMLWHLM